MIQRFRGPLLEFPLSSTSRTVLRLLVKMIKTHRIFQSGLDHNSKFSLGSHKIISTPNQQEVAWNTISTFPSTPKKVMDAYLCFDCWLQVVMDNGQRKKLNQGD